MADLVVITLVDSWYMLGAWFLLGIVPKGAAASYNHHHQHLNVFTDTFSNRALELVYGMQTGIVSHAWVLHHSVGHHVHYLDQKTDESRWRRKNGKVMGEIEYTFIGGMVAYLRALRSGGRYPKYRSTMLRMLGLTLALVAVAFIWRPLQVTTVLIMPMVFGLFWTVWATYTHHTGKRVDSHYVASNNIMHRGYNRLTGNLGYHTAHHLKPGAHWSKLPELHSSIAHMIPADCYITPGLPFRFGQRVIGPPPGMPFASGTSVEPDSPVIVPAA